MAFADVRFFEYLLSKDILPTQLQLEDCLRIVHQAHTFPYLWGAMEMRLSTDLEDSKALIGNNLITELAQQDSIEIRGLLADTLEKYARESDVKFQQVENLLLDSLLKLKSSAAGLIAAEVGSKLQLGDVLEQACNHPDPAVRQYALQRA